MSMVDGLNTENWKEDHLNFKHKKYYDWCSLCMAKKKGEGKSAGNDVHVGVIDSVPVGDVFGKTN